MLDGEKTPVFNHGSGVFTEVAPPSAYVMHLIVWPLDESEAIVRGRKPAEGRMAPMAVQPVATNFLRYMLEVFLDSGPPFLKRSCNGAALFECGR